MNLQRPTPAVERTETAKRAVPARSPMSVRRHQGRGEVPEPWMEE
jgi:hypothetical protein